MRFDLNVPRACTVPTTISNSSVVCTFNEKVKIEQSVANLWCLFIKHKHGFLPMLWQAEPQSGSRDLFEARRHFLNIPSEEQISPRMFYCLTFSGGVRDEQEFTAPLLPFLRELSKCELKETKKSLSSRVLWPRKKRKQRGRTL